MNVRALEPGKQRFRQGLTLVELLITIAVSGIIVTITFTGLRTEQQRSAAKDATDRLQVQLVDLQNKMQSSVSLTTKYCTRGGGNYTLLGTTCDCATSTECETDTECLAGTVQGRCVSGPPGGYGLSIAISPGTNYNIFADMPSGVTTVNGIYDTTATNDKLLMGNKSLGQNIQVAALTTTSSTGTSSAASRLDISFSGVNGQVIINNQSAGSCGSACVTAKIVLRHAVTGVCYSVVVDKASQIVGKRQNSPACT